MNAIIKAIFASLIEQVQQVNRRYARPELALSPFTRFCLVALRVYLLAMILLMGWFLIQKIRGLGQ